MTAGRAAAEQVAVDRADAADQPVGRRVGDQVVERRGAGAGRRSRAGRTRRTSPSSTRSATFSRAVRRPPRRRRLATASGRASSSPTRWRSSDLGEVGAHRAGAPSTAPATSAGRVAVLVRRRPAPGATSTSPGITAVPTSTSTSPTRPASGGDDLVVHLHRLDEDQHRAGADHVAGRDLDRHDRALQRAADLLHGASSQRTGPELAAAPVGDRSVGVRRRGAWRKYSAVRVRPVAQLDRRAPSRAACGPA